MTNTSKQLQIKDIFSNFIIIYLIILVSTPICLGAALTKYQTRRYLTNKTLIVSVIVREPFVIFNKNGPSRIKRITKSQFKNTTLVENEYEADISDPLNYSGVAVQVLNRLAQMFRFKYKFVRPKDGLFGSRKPDGTWDGLVGDVFNNVSDIGLTALSITLERMLAVDFSRAYFVETTAILIPKPEEEKNYFAIFQPFSMTVWLVLLITIISLIMLIPLMSWFEDASLSASKRRHESRLFKAKTNLHYNDNTSRLDISDHNSASVNISSKNINGRKGSLAIKRSLRETRAQKHYWVKQFYYSVSCVINILLIRDIEDPPRQNPIRILLCVWWLSTIVIVNIYFGILFGQLVIPRVPHSIDTLEELANQDKIKWSVTRGSATYDLFRKSAPDSIYAKIGRSMENATSAEYGINRTLNSGWAFIREKSILTFKISEYHTRMKQCKMKLAKEEFFSVGFGLAFKKGAPYTNAFDSAIGMMIENGFVARWQAQYWPTKNVYTQCDEGPSEGEPLSMKHFLSIYLVCSLIILASAGILLYQSTHKHVFVGQMKPLILRMVQWIRNSRERRRFAINLNQTVA